MQYNNILITSAGKRVALTVYFQETLNRFFPDAKVFVADMNPEMAPVSYVCDGSFKVPIVTAPEYPAVLLNLCEKNEVGMVIPAIDTELLLLADLKSEFAKKGIDIIVGDRKFITMCRDKRNTGQFFEKHNVRVPAEVDKYNPTFPLFAKPYDGSLSADLHYIKAESELTEDILNDPKLIFMEYIDRNKYKEFTVDMYFGKDNDIKCVIPRERIEIRAGEINKGRTHKDFLMEFIKERFGHIDGCIGCICMQLFYNENTGDVVGIEINPRFGGGYPLSYKAGGNYIELLIREYFLGESVKYCDTWKDGLLMLRYDDAIYV